MSHTSDLSGQLKQHDYSTTCIGLHMASQYAAEGCCKSEQWEQSTAGAEPL